MSHERRFVCCLTQYMLNIITAFPGVEYVHSQGPYMLGRLMETTLSAAKISIDWYVLHWVRTRWTRNWRLALPHSLVLGTQLLASKWVRVYGFCYTLYTRKSHWLIWAQTGMNRSPVIMAGCLQVVISGMSGNQPYSTESLSDKMENGASLLSSIAVSSTRIYTNTQNKVLSIPIQECHTATGCKKCALLNDPYCGWCSLSNR